MKTMTINWWPIAITIPSEYTTPDQDIRMAVFGLLVMVAFVLGKPSRRKDNHVGTASDSPALSPGEVGYLRAGPRRAMMSALLQMLAGNVIRTTHRGAIVRGGKLPPGATPLERAIYGRVYTKVGVADLRQAPKVRKALADLRASLVERDLLLPTWRYIALRTAILLSLSIAGWEITAMAREVAPVLPTVFLLVVALSLMVVSWLSGDRTWAGRRVLSQLRRQYPKKAADPEVRTGSVDAGFQGALHGAAGVWPGEFYLPSGLIAYPADWSGGDSNSGGSDSGGY